MKPSELIVADTSKSHCVLDNEGRELQIRQLGALDRLRLYKTLGDQLSSNDSYFGVAYLAASVTQVDGVPLPWPGTEAQIEAAVSRLGDAGLDAVASELDRLANSKTATDQKTIGNPEGNAAGTPS